MGSSKAVRRLFVLVAALALAVPAFATGSSSAAGPRVLLVGSYHGIRGQYPTIQSAVCAARPGDWVLVGPGDYKEVGYARTADCRNKASYAHEPAGVLITVRGLWLRGMNRNTVIVDGTRAGSPTCSSRPADQVVTKQGRDGVEVYEVNGTWVQNLTVCNFLTDKTGGYAGNEIWWNGGQSTGRIHMGSYHGSYLTATSTYSRGAQPPFGDYGIYADNVSGPAVIDHSYASNMGDSAYYIGACRPCRTVLTRAHAQDSSLGFSGTNSGGYIIEHSRFDHNKTGPTSNSQNNGDAPSPEIGLCQHGQRGPLGNGICTVWEHNVIVDNNNPDVPGNASNGLAGAAPVGAGVVFAGDRYTELYRNYIAHNNSWGVLVVDLPDPEAPPPHIGQHCNGGFYASRPPAPPMCYYDSYGNRIIGNTLLDNGDYGNPTNSDLANYAMNLQPRSGYKEPDNCFVGNRDRAGLTSDPPAIQRVWGTCGVHRPSPEALLAAEAECASQLLGPCPSLPGTHYPRARAHFALRMPRPQPTMPRPCAGVPANPWCPAPAGSSGGGWRPLGLPVGFAAPLAAGLVFLLAGPGVLRRRRRATARPA